MKKAVFVAMLLGAVVASAEDSYLYWMVGDSAPAYTYAKVRDATTGTYLNLYDEYLNAFSPATQISQADVLDASAHGENLYASLANLTASQLANASFIVELFNDGNFVGQSEAIPYSSTYVYYGGSTTPPSTAWSASSFAVPEPNSGLLMLLGCAVLGLRRRRQKKA